MSGLPGFTGDSLPVSPGKLYGLRVFGVDIESGALSGVSYPEEWHNGENLATCHDTNNSSKRHSMKDCYHGYWSYFGAKLDMLTVDRACAIIEGYGEVVVGELGFRSEKARIKGIVTPDIKGITERKTTKIEEQIRTTLKEEVSLLQGVVFWLAVLLTASYFIITKGGFSGILEGILTVAAGLYAVLLFLAVCSSVWLLFDIRAKRKKQQSEISVSKRHTQDNWIVRQKELEARIQERYPDATLYPTLNAMLEAHQKDLIPHGTSLF